MHVVLHITCLPDGHYAASFTIHPARGAFTKWPAVQLDRAFSDIPAAVREGMAIIETHMTRRFDMGVDDYTFDVTYD